MSQHAFSRLSVLEQSTVDMFVEGEDVPEDARGFRKWVRRVWWGSSNIRDRVEVKRLCCGEQETRKATAFDPERKLWGTHALENVPKLIASGLWKPDRIDERLADIIAMRATAVLNEEERELREKEERKLEKEREKERAKAERAKGGGNRKAATVFAGAKRKKEEVEEVEEVEESGVDGAPLSASPAAPAAEKLPESFSATQKEFAEALWTYKLPRRIFIDATSWSWLGPTCSSSIVRIRRWFEFQHNRTRGTAVVAKKDFLDYYDQRVRNRRLAEEDEELNERVAAAQASANAAQGAWCASDMAKFEKLKQKEQNRVRKNQESEAKRKYEAEHGEEAKALRVLLEKAKAMRPIKQSAVLRCPECGVKPLQQFMECVCVDAESANWQTCQKCDTVYHPTKVPCGC